MVLNFIARALRAISISPPKQKLLPPPMLMNQTQESGFMPNTQLEAKGTYFLQIQTSTIYIGLPLISSTEEIIIQLSRPSDKELNLLNLHIFVDFLSRDPDLAHISSHTIPTIVQALFVSTGCDYISFFSGIGKAYFQKVFFLKKNKIHHLK